MIRLPVLPRLDWEKKAEENGFIFHHVNGDLYWDESVCYQFTLQEIEEGLEDPTQELADMCLQLVEEVTQSDVLLDLLAIPSSSWELVRQSWERREPSLYGRFDFFYNGVDPAKLYEFNADTPTSLYEAAYFQWSWLEDARMVGIVPKDADQFNLIQESLITTLETFLPLSGAGTLHCACVSESAEDFATVCYLCDCAAQAGFSVKQIFIEEIALDGNGNFLDKDGEPIYWLFKLYPWEFMVKDAYAPFLAACDTMFIEPAWKMILSNKAILPLLWERYPEHPNLLPAWFHSPGRPAPYPDYVLKPIFSREGANIAVYRDHKKVFETSGVYGEEGFIGQVLCPPPCLDGFGPVVGSWLVNNMPCGIGIREDANPITGDASRFVPHIILK